MENVQEDDAMDIDGPQPVPATQRLRDTFAHSVRATRAQPLRRRGVHRNLTIVLDGGQSIIMRDLLPSRLELMLRTLNHFIPKFFEENPLSQLQLVQTSDALAKIITPLSGNSQQHLQALKAPGVIPGVGDISLKNSLDVALDSLKSIPKYGTREILLVLSSLSTCDPGPLGNSIAALNEANITEVYVFKQLCESTKGIFRVCRNEAHFAELLLAFLKPPEIPSEPTDQDKKPIQDEAVAIETGFPVFRRVSPATYCACHRRLTTEGYYCPQCGSKQCHVPSHCTICGLTLAAFTDLAVSYHHLFPLDPFAALTSDRFESLDGDKRFCAGCFKALEKPTIVEARSEEESLGQAFECPICSKIFCPDCDQFIHHSLLCASPFNFCSCFRLLRLLAFALAALEINLGLVKSPRGWE